MGELNHSIILGNEDRTLQAHLGATVPYTILPCVDAQYDFAVTAMCIWDLRSYATCISHECCALGIM